METCAYETPENKTSLGQRQHQLPQSQAGRRRGEARVPKKREPDDEQLTVTREATGPRQTWAPGLRL